MKTFIIFFLALLSHSIPGLADESLPGDHILVTDDQGAYLVKNKDDIVMIDPDILSIGYNRKWILACVQNESIDTDLKRYFFINLKTGGTTDTINQDNWDYFRGVYPELVEIDLKPLRDEPCL